MPGIKVESEYYEPEEVVGIMGFGMSWFRKYAKPGQIPGAVKIGGRWKVLKTDFDNARRESQLNGIPFLLSPKAKAHATT